MDKIKTNVTVSRTMQVLLLNSMALNHWFFGDWSGAWMQIVLIGLLQAYIMVVKTKMRRIKRGKTRMYNARNPHAQSRAV